MFNKEAIKMELSQALQQLDGLHMVASQVHVRELIGARLAAAKGRIVAAMEILDTGKTEDELTPAQKAAKTRAAQKAAESADGD